jgi:hypothetical protein
LPEATKINPNPYDDNTGPLYVPEVPYDSSQEVPDCPWPPAPDGFENYGDAVKADKHLGSLHDTQKDVDKTIVVPK